MSRKGICQGLPIPRSGEKKLRFDGKSKMSIVIRLVFWRLVQFPSERSPEVRDCEHQTLPEVNYSYTTVHRLY